MTDHGVTAPGPRRSRLDAHDAFVASDAPWQAELRLRQSLWRQTQGLSCGSSRGREAGWRLPLPFARDTLANFITPTVRDVVLREVCDPTVAHGKLFRRPAIFDDLLSNQALAFNLFGELTTMPSAASAALRRLFPRSFSSLATMDFQWSPGTGDRSFLGDRTAFDVMIRHSTPAGGRGFVALMVWHASDLARPPATPVDRYDQAALGSGVFGPDVEVFKSTSALRHLYVRHSLALAMATRGGWDAATLLVVYPEENAAVADAVHRYRTALSDPSGFRALTIGALVEAVADHVAADWRNGLTARYLTPTAQSEPDRSVVAERTPPVLVRGSRRRRRRS